MNRLALLFWQKIGNPDRGLLGTVHCTWKSLRSLVYRKSSMNAHINHAYKGEDGWPGGTSGRIGEGEEGEERGRPIVVAVPARVNRERPKFFPLELEAG